MMSRVRAMVGVCVIESPREDAGLALLFALSSLLVSRMVCGMQLSTPLIIKPKFETGLNFEICRLAALAPGQKQYHEYLLDCTCCPSIKASQIPNANFPQR